MSKESASELQRLYSTITQVRSSLQLLGCSMAGLDHYLVHSTSKSFDPETLKAWELHFGASKSMPLWSQLADFILGRLHTLKSCEHSTNPKSTASMSNSSSGVRTNHAKTSVDDKAQVRSPPQCCLCPERHYVSRCPVYANKTIEQREEVISKYDLCFNCLGKHHSKACYSTRRYRKCGKKHHTTLHRHSTEPAIESTPTVQANHASGAQTSYIFLTTAKILITSENSEQSHARALIDQGSEASLITERMVQKLRLPREAISTNIIGVGGSSTSRMRGIAQFNVHSHYDFSKSLNIRAHILLKLTNALPSTSQLKGKWPHLQGLEMADPDFFITGPIDVILGADVYGQILEEGIIIGGSSLPTAQLTKLGWIVSGPSGSTNEPTAIRTLHLKVDLDLNEQLQRFWTLDEVPSTFNSKLTKADEECEQHFITTHSRDKDGRYIVRLPFKGSSGQLGDSKPKALRMLFCLQKKFSVNPAFKQSYTEFIQEYEKLHLVPVAPNTPEPDVAYYLPYLGVLKESSLTTKLRVMFNGSSSTSSGKSLNDLLHSGGKLQIDLFDVLLYFRLHRYVFSGDIEKFYRQIKVYPEDWKFQRILWYSGSQLVTYELTTDTYGLTCAAFLALRAFQQLIVDEGSKYPLALQALSRGRYVDDIVGGADTIDEAKAQIHQIINLCMAGGFAIQKWNSNHPDTLSNVPPERRLEALSKPMDDNSNVHALGLAWQPKADTFHFTIKLTTDPPVTKRKVLFAIAQIFDPLGFISPVVIVAKIFVQELWTVKLGWDDELSRLLAYLARISETAWSATTTFHSAMAVALFNFNI